MKTLSQHLIAEKNKLNSNNPWLILIEITLTDDDSTVFRLVRNVEDVEYGGNTYQAFPFELEATKYDSKGQIPTLSLRVSNITRVIQPYLEDLNGGIGSTVKITVINAGFLNDAYAELEMTFDVISCSSDVEWVEFILGAPSLLRRRMPLYRYLAMHCRWKYGGDECGHSGGSCNRTLADCRTNSNTAKFGGFIGLKSGGIKIV